jgi:hypothetical protein
MKQTSKKKKKKKTSFSNEIKEECKDKHEFDGDEEERPTGIRCM